MSRSEMPDVEPLTCIVCVRQVDPTSEEAEGWVLVPHSVADGDEHDDFQWKCNVCALPSDEMAARSVLEDGDA